MKIKIQVIIEAEGGNPEIVQEIGQLERTALRVEEFGLKMAEAKALLQGVQKTMVEQQSAEYLREQAHCSQCGRKRLHKGEHPIVYRILFGKLRLKSPRLYHCRVRSMPGEASVRWQSYCKSGRHQNCCMWNRSLQR